MIYVLRDFIPILSAIVMAILFSSFVGCTGAGLSTEPTSLNIPVPEAMQTCPDGAVGDEICYEGRKVYNDQGVFDDFKSTCGRFMDEGERHELVKIIRCFQRNEDFLKYHLFLRDNQLKKTRDVLEEGGLFNE